MLKQNTMKKILLFILLIGCCQPTFSQIKFDISKIKKTEVKKFDKKNSLNMVYLYMTFGGSDFTNKNNFKKLENKIIRKVKRKDIEIIKIKMVEVNLNLDKPVKS